MNVNGDMFQALPGHTPSLLHLSTFSLTSVLSSPFHKTRSMEETGRPLSLELGDLGLSTRSCNP